MMSTYAQNPQLMIQQTQAQQGGKPGPRADTPKPGRMMHNESPTAPSGNAQMNPRDFVRPRAVDVNTNAKGVDEQDQPDPF
jgi:hypothetical protein